MLRLIQCLIGILVFSSYYSSVRADDDRPRSSSRALSTIWAEIEGVPNDMFADDARCRDTSLSGKLLLFKDRKTKQLTTWCVRFPVKVNINGHPLPVEAVTGSDGLPHIMVRLPSDGHTFTLGRLELTTLNDQEYATEPVTIRLSANSFGVYFGISATYTDSSTIKSDPRVCLSVDKDSGCIENQQIRSGSYLLREKKGHTALKGRACTLMFDKSCPEDYKKKSSVDDFNETCRDEAVVIGCNRQKPKSDGKSFGLVQHIIQRVTLPEYFYLCPKKGCSAYPYQVGKRVTIEAGMGEYVFVIYQQKTKPK